MKKINFTKILKNFVIAWISLTIIICVGAIIKYNLDLNEYINQDEPDVQAQKHSIKNGTEVYVVGSMHFETNNFKRDDLYTYINKVAPSIILYESDKQTANRMVNRTDFFNQLMSSFKKGNKVESFVAIRFLKHHPEAKVFGYEWEDRDRFHFKHNYRKNMGKLIGLAHKLNREKALSNQESKIMSDYHEVRKRYNNLGNSKTLYDFNNPITDSIINIRQTYVYHIIPEILKSKELSDDLKEFLPFHMNYWDTRNMAMVNNIVNQIKNNPNKRIVVLTGYSHRYYLIGELKKLEEEFNFSVKPI
ncbi:hypothetical protein RXV94_11635 [Yeosuana sp. MJ-SS3]|uniref:Haem-binding uptake Tiki superfamily ChaN domain-containing protein n=1 Tax=Gilvirhabdus luticola TaxID=3079858 RepID=A0ABU3U907_9FLAO|nr:hypothetical protein [Yeosuana sp. MJ-SS3]MDU8886814.1 hypothetical protein [Yeosuana sp. MJ-SS3]